MSENTYNPNINKTIIYYDEMTDALINAIPDNKENPRILDLGCGTGGLVKKIFKRFPKAQVVCVDISDLMIKIAKENLSQYNNIEFIQDDFTKMNFIHKYDAVISSVTLNYLSYDSKKELLEKIYNALNKGGVFYNADFLMPNSKYNDILNHRKFEEYLKEKDILIQNATNDEKIKKYTSSFSVLGIINLLDSIGFKEIDLIWKYYSNGVLGGTKL
ncbi:class I SAM-dependent methyltransferase [Methanosphaera sp.]